MKYLILSALLAFLMLACSQKSVDTQVSELVSQLTLEEKVELLGGTGFDSKPIERLGIPPIKMADGPLGIRWDTSTAFPATIAMSASWNKELAGRVGEAIAKEVREKGRDMLLAPCVNLVRTPQGGRNFESYGEDPFLASRMSVEYIKGVQSKDVMACIKHYAVNNQEYERTTISANVDERTLREIYLPAFKTGVQEGHVASVMSAYNKLNGIYCSEDDFLLNKILKDEWQFDGFVVSDWGAVHSKLETAKYGVDIEMPTGKYMDSTLVEDIKNGTVNEKTIDDKVTRLLRTAMRFGLFDRKPLESKENPYEVNKGVAYDAAVESMVLLKNNNRLLPLKKENIRSLAVLGPNAAKNRVGGGGSSRVGYAFSMSPLEAIKDKMGEEVVVNYAPGCSIVGELNIVTGDYLQTEKEGMVVNGLTGYYFTNKDFEGEPALVRVDEKIDFDWGGGPPADEIKEDNFSVRWKGSLVPKESGKFELGFITDDGVRLFINGKKVLEDWVDRAPAYSGYALDLKKDRKYDIVIEYYENGGGAVAKFGWAPINEDILGEAVKLAENSDMTIIFAGLSESFESEGVDRASLSIPEDQEKLIDAITKLGKEYVLVLNNGGQLVMPDVYEKAPAVLEAWFSGQEGGQAVADILFGDANPSGKLPYTIPKRWEDCSSFKYYPENNDTISYEDGIFIGYRHFDKYAIQPQFYFGFGLSYTQFKIEDVKIDKEQFGKSDYLQVSCKVINIGNVAGAEVIQAYVGCNNSDVERAVKELKAFEKVFLQAGETKEVKLSIKVGDLAYYNVDTKSWVVEDKDYTLYVGNTSNEENLAQLKFSVKN